MIIDYTYYRTETKTCLRISHLLAWFAFLVLSLIRRVVQKTNSQLHETV